MPAPRWASRAQLTFLRGRLPAFSNAQENKTLPTFWTDTYREFFSQWPDPATEELSKEQADGDGSDDGTTQQKTETRKKKKRKNLKENNTSSVVDLPLEDWVTLRRTSVYNWYNNHNLNKGTRRAGKINSVTVVLQPSVSRVSSEHHLYSKRYYESRVKADVDKEIGDQNIEPGRKIAIINKHLQEKYSKESEDIKNEIRAGIEKERKEKLAEKETFEAIANGTEDLTAEQYMIAQSVAPDMIKDFMESMSRRTGWSFSMLAGGPSPELKGAIRTIALHSGINVHGLSYAKFHPSNHKKFIAPYNNFLKTVYPLAPNDKRFKLETTENNKEDPSSKVFDENGEAGGMEHNNDEEFVTKLGTSSLKVDGAGGVGVGEVKKQAIVDQETHAGELTGGLGKTITLLPLSSDHVSNGATINDPGYTFGNPKSSLPQQLSYQHPVLQPSSHQHGDNTLNFQRNLPDNTATAAIPTGGTGSTATSLQSGNTQWDLDLMSDDIFDPDLVANMLSAADWAAINAFVGTQPPGMAPGSVPDNGQILGIGSPASSLTTPGNTAITSTEVSSISSILPLPPNVSGNVNQNIPTSPKVREGDKGGNVTENEGGGEENVEKNVETSATGRTRRSATTKKEVSPWLAAAKEYLENGITDEIWTTCIESWMLFENEISLSDVSAHRLPVRLRPPILSKWMASRKYTKIPEIENKLFSNQWLEWWNGIQPDWRQSDGPGPIPNALDRTEARDISCIRKGGPSGLVTVLTGLKWWAEDPTTKDLWLAAVEDVSMCFELMKTPAGGTGQKRKGNADKGGKGNGKPKAKKQKI